MIKMKQLLGAHFSVTGGLHQALFTAEELNCPTLQIFTKNARSWKEPIPDPESVELFNRERNRIGFHSIISHASYLINIAGTDKIKLTRSIKSLEAELRRSALLNIDYLVLHPGAYLTSSPEDGIRRAANSLKTVFKATNTIAPRLLIETTAGQGTCLGHSFNQIASILDKTGNENRIGVCMDTCHMFAAGYDIRTVESYEKVMSDFENTIGFHRLYAIHLNDSQSDLASRIDRHDHIGNGFIGENGFKLIMNDSRFKSIPKILETPKELDLVPMDQINLNRLLAMVN